jgi:hypothetical protein
MRSQERKIESNDHWVRIPKRVSEESAMIQRSHFGANPTRFNPNQTPYKKSAKLFCFIFYNLALGKTTDQAV